MNLDRIAAHLQTLYAKVERDGGYRYHEAFIDNSMKYFVEGGAFKTALDVGFGTGHALRKFLGMGIAARGITLNAEEAEEAKGRGYDVAVMDMAMLDYEDKSFDLVWCRHALEHSPMPIIALMEFHRVLTDAGFLYVEVPSDCTFSIENSSHIAMFSDEAWQDLFRKAGFELRFRGQYCTVKHTAPGTDMDALYHDNYWYYWLKREVA